MNSDEYNKRLERDGYVDLTVAEFFGIAPARMELIDTQIVLQIYADERRQKLGWTRARLAKEMGASEARVARIEQGGSGLPIEFLLRAAFALGAKMEDIGSALVEDARMSAEAEKAWRLRPAPKKRPAPKPKKRAAPKKRARRVRAVAAQPASARL